MTLLVFYHIGGFFISKGVNDSDINMLKFSA